jgi:hypothetical protein
MNPVDRLNRVEHLRRREASAESWVPKTVGEIVDGIVEAFGTVTLPDREARTLVLRNEDTGDRLAVLLARTVLKNGVEKRQVKEGDWLAIKYLGERKPAGGKPYFDYDFEHVRSEDMEDERAEANQDGAGVPPAEDADDIPF